MKHCIVIIMAALVSFHVVQAQSDWEAVSGIEGGRVFAVVETPSGVSFAGCASGGVYRSTDAGQTWSYGGLTSRTVRTLHWHDGRLYAGLQSGLRWSDDGGDTWLTTGLTQNQNGFGIAVNSQGHIFVGGWDGIFRSTDDGGNWEDLSAGLATGGNRINHVAVTSSDRLFITTSGGGIQGSTDNGVTWTSVDSQFDGARGYEINADGNRIAAAIPSFGIVVSTDDGVTWEVRSNGIESHSFNAVMFAGGDELYAGSSGGLIYHSTDLGLNWTAAGSTGEQVIQIVSAGSGMLAACDYGGVFRTEDKLQWASSMTGLSSIMVSDLEIAGSEIYMSSNGNPVMYSDDLALTWTATADDANGAQAVDLDQSGRVYAASGYYFYTSTDHGATWEIDTAGLPEYRLFQFQVRDDGYIFASGLSKGIFRASAAGNGWTDASTGLPEETIYEVCCAGSYVFAGTNGSGLYRTSDDGANWTKVENGLSGGFCNSIAYLESTGELFVGMRYNLQVSTDMGDSWTSLQYNYSSGGSIGKIAFGPQGEVFVANMYQGIHVLKRGAQTWIDLSDGLLTNSVRALHVASDGTMFAGTQGNGLFRRKFVPLSAKDNAAPVSMTLEQNYPNPFNPSTTFRFSLPRSGNVRLTVCDLLGRELQVLNEGRMEAGTHIRYFDAAKLPSGSYLYTMTFEHTAVSRMMTVLR